jgi:hypothetical protein
MDRVERNRRRRAATAARKVRAKQAAHRDYLQRASVAWASQVLSAADARAVDGDRAGKWKIQERGAPTPRAYSAAVRRWMRAVSREVIAAIRGAVVGLPMSDADDPADDAKKAAAIRTSTVAAMRIREALRRMRLPPPPLRVLEGVVEQAGATAIRAARAGLIAGGAPRAA